jgi:hypothetical protein
VNTQLAIAPARATPKHQVPRSMPITRPRSRAGQVSAISGLPGAHSPFRANATTLPAVTKATNVVVSSTIGILSRNSAMLIASKPRRPLPLAARRWHDLRREPKPES